MVLDLGEDRGRLAVSGQLAPQPTVHEDRQLPLLAHVRFPQLVARDPSRPSQKRSLLDPASMLVQVSLEAA